MNYETERLAEQERFLDTQVPKPILLLTAGMAVVYFTVIATWFERGNALLFWLLLASHAFYLWQLLTYLYTAWDTEYEHAKDPHLVLPVDVFVTVAGEPLDVVEETARAALAMDYPDFTVYLLNDGYVAKKENWQEVEELAARLGIRCITRRTPGGAKAGNINNALRQTKGTLVTIFDADHVAKPEFLRTMVPYFVDPKMGFVQSPQFYKNRNVNYLAGGAWEQQTLFFGPICKGKNRLNAVTMCGTNMVIRREALTEVGGMCESSITEDFLTGLFMHERGWRSAYVPKVLAEGLAPEDFLSYYKQQYRWVRGGIDMIFSFGLFGRKISFGQKLQYVSSLTFFFSGMFVVLNALIPVVYLYTGLAPLVISTMTLTVFFVPYVALTLYVLLRSSNGSFTYRALAFSTASFSIHLRALYAVLTGEKTAFSITPKRAVQGNYLKLVIPHLAYVPIALGGVAFALLREGFTPGVIGNICWVVVNMALFLEFVRVAMPKRARQTEQAPSLRLRAETNTSYV